MTLPADAPPPAAPSAPEPPAALALVPLAQTGLQRGTAVKDKHVAALEKIRVYFAADPAALATQALSYIEPDLSQTIAHVYAAQRQLDAATRDITLVMYTRGGDPDPVPFTRSLSIYFDDCTLFEPRLLKLYDDALGQLDARLGPRK